MAIQVRRGALIDLDINQLLPGELALGTNSVTGTAELHFCFGAGQTHKLATQEDLTALLTSAPEAYTALQELLTQIEDNEVLQNILNDIAGKIDTTEKGVAGGVATLDGTGKVPSSQLPSIASDASDITFDNSSNGFTADDAQTAIEESRATAITISASVPTSTYAHQKFFKIV